MNVTLRQLRAFVLVARLGSFTRAAQAMHVTQSALSLLVRELESTLGARLLNRTTRTVTPTAVGAEFLVTAQRVLSELEHAVDNVDKMLAKERGRVVVAAPLVISGTLLPPLLASFRTRYPGVGLVLKDSLPDQVLPQVRSGEADLCIGTFHRVQDDIERVLLFRESLVAVFPRGQAPAPRRSARLHWGDLRGLPILALPRGSVFRELADAGLAAAGVVAEPAMEASYVGTLLGLVRAGMGVAVVPGYATALADPKALEWRLLDRPAIHREVWMAQLAHRALSPAAQAFKAHVLEAIVQARQPRRGKSAVELRKAGA